MPGTWPGTSRRTCARRAIHREPGRLWGLWCGCRGRGRLLQHVRGQAPASWRGSRAGPSGPAALRRRPSGPAALRRHPRGPNAVGTHDHEPARRVAHRRAADPRVSRRRGRRHLGGPANAGFVHGCDLHPVACLCAARRPGSVPEPGVRLLARRAGQLQRDPCRREDERRCALDLEVRSVRRVRLAAGRSGRTRRRTNSRSDRRRSRGGQVRGRDPRLQHPDGRDRINPGAGAVYDLYVGAGNADPVHARAIVMAAVQGDLAIVMESLGPWVSDARAGHPNPAQALTPVCFSGVLTSVTWPGEAPP